MNLSTHRCLLVRAAIFLLYTASACTPVAPPAPATITPSVGRTGETPATTPVLVAFPTTAPSDSRGAASPTAMLSDSRATVEARSTATATVSATLTGGRTSAALPVVQVVAPLANAQFSLNQTVYVIAYAAGENGIWRIELADDNALVRAENMPAPFPQTFPAVIPWTPTQLGTHVLRVVAFDANNQASAPEEVPVSVVPDARRPTATIVYPIGTPQVELGSVLQLHAVATDEVGVTQFDLWVDNQLYTYVTSQNANGQSPFPVVFAWSALTPGNHVLFVRAHDTQDQTTDSSPLRVFVADTHAPALSAAFDRTNALVNESIAITITALDASGIQRIELWNAKDAYASSTITSVSPARQTSMTAQVAWQSASPGDYQLTVRAYNANGNYKESPAQTISVLRPGQSTPTRAPTPTSTRTRAPRPAPTRRLQPPAPPSAEIAQPADRFSNQWPVRVIFSGQGNAELDRIELWGYYQGQLNPQVICVIDAHATTQKAGQCEWAPTVAGVVSLFAQAVDVYHQTGRSAPISGTIGVPGLPTPTPTPASLAGRWSATTSTGQYVATLRQIGAAIRGDFKIITTGTPATEIAGRIPSGSIKGDHVTFRVEFSPLGAPTATSAPDLPTPTAAPAPTPLAPALEFDCAVDPNAIALDCKSKDARGQSGAVLFRRESAP